MPPVNQTGSRAGLITALVITVILAFVLGIYATYYYVELETARKETQAAKASLADVASNSELKGEAYQALKDVRGPDKTSIFSVLMQQRDELAKAIPVAPGKLDAMKTEIKNAVAKAAVGLPPGVQPTDDLLGTMGLLSQELAKKTATIAERDAALDAAAKKNDGLGTSYEAGSKERQGAVEAAQAAQMKAEADLAAYSKKKDEELASVQEANAKMVASLQEQNNNLQVQVSTQTQAMAQAKKELGAMRAQMAALRVNVNDATARQPDGVITQITAGNTAYINLGTGDHISAGLTFEVYDKLQGIPRPGEAATDAPDSQLPVGKASIEVINVGQNSSECRVVRTTTGQHLIEGDLIANLVYDRNTKLKFVVYGGDGFDLTQNGRANSQDTEIIKRLIARWGGAVSDVRFSDQGRATLGVDTDFVILGQEPVLPNYSADDPIQVDAYERAKKRLEAYDAVRNAAGDLHVPILNQNRFLYAVGYYDQARK